ncbi:MAG TPA: TonB-dependent receptor, partial [Pyrinomonadaceae bacterium]|nr:TonB-dependent receptor [Pyrinomonadaceae bacterium]
MPISRPELFAFLILLLFVVFPAPTYAQTTTGTILGTVTDEQGAVVAGATITIKNVETGVTRTITTDDGGRYRVPSLPLGQYEVNIERQGFTTELRSGIELTVGREAVVDFSLKVGNVQETVKVSGEAPLVQTTNGALEGLVDERTVRELPLNGRDVFQLTTLQVGVTNTAGITGQFGAGAIDVGPGTTKIAVNGARITANLFLLDGTMVNDALNNTPGAVSGGFMGVDMLREFQILTSSYNSEYGSAGGAIINSVTKGGTNDFHGTAYEFLRNDNLDARNFFDRCSTTNLNCKAGGRPEFRRNQYGGSVGGPIITNKTFFFGGYEGLRDSTGVSRRFAVPKLSARARAAPSVQPYVNLYPLPNGEDLGPDTANYIRAGNDKTKVDSFMGRIDHQISDNDSLFGRYTFLQSSLDLSDQVIQNSLTSGRNQYLTLGEDHIFSPRVLNTFRFGFNRSFISSDRPFAVDIPESLPFVPGRPLGSIFGVSEIAPLGSSLFTPRFFAYNTFEFSDQLGIIRGAHSIKTGFTARRLQLNAASNVALDGVYVYFGLPPIPGVFPDGLSTLNAFLFGFPVAFVAPAPGSNFYRGIRESVIGSYVQDDWKINRKLTLNLGLRYEFITTPTEANDKIANLRHVTDPAPTVGEPFFRNPTKKNFAPRVGFAYDPFGDGKTSIRGGYGIFDIPILPFDYRYEMSNQPPFALSATLQGFGVDFPFFVPFPNAFDSIANAQAPARPMVNSFDFDPNRSYMQQFNLSVQREVVPTFVLTAAYTGSRGVHLARKNNINQRTDFTFVNGRKFFPPVPPDTDPQILNPNVAAIRHIFWDANSNYHAMQLRAEKRFSHGLDFQASYTWSKAIDDASTTESAFANTPPGARLQDAFDPKGERGLAAFDIRHNLVVSGIYELPKNSSWNGFKDKLLNGWEVT